MVRAYLIAITLAAVVEAAMVAALLPSNVQASPDYERRQTEALERIEQHLAKISECRR